MPARALFIMEEKIDIPCHRKRIHSISGNLKFGHHLAGTHDDYLNLQAGAAKVGLKIHE